MEIQKGEIVKSTQLRQERIRRGWTLAYVAAEIGITNQAISKIELGKSNPSYEVLVKLENLFNLSYRKLLAVTSES